MHWQPPAEALEAVKEAVHHPTVSKYGADDGMPELRQALLEKVNFSSFSTRGINKTAMLECTAQLGELPTPTKITCLL